MSSTVHDTPTVEAEHAPETTEVPKARASLRPRLWLIALLAIGGVLLHLAWFGRGIITFGDWTYSSPVTMRNFFRLPQAWLLDRGLGGPNTGLSSAPYEVLYGVLGVLHVPYAIAERVLTFFPFAFLPFFSMYKLSARFTKRGSIRFVAGLIFGANTYVIAIGNQHLFVAIAYSLFPLALDRAMAASEVPSLGRRPATLTIRNAVFAGLLLSLTLVVDSRIAFLSTVAVFMYLAAVAIFDRRIVTPLATGVAIGAVLVLTQLYWILPVTRASAGSAYAGLVPSEPWISWAKITHALGLNDPFWTIRGETIFHVHRPVAIFLALPIVAFAALAIPRVSRHWRVIFFAALTLLGVFLVKGENPPLGAIYSWAYRNVPGMDLFRDMSKFNLYVAAGYAVLIAISLDYLMSLRKRDASTTRHSSSSGSTVPNVAQSLLRIAGPAAMALVIVAVAVGAYPQLTGRMDILHTKEVPSAYKSIDELLASDHTFGRVLWLPAEPRFSARSRLHPALTPTDLVNAIGIAAPVRSNEGRLIDPGLPTSLLYLDNISDYLRAYGVRYIAVAGGEESILYGGTTDEERHQDMLRLEDRISQLTGQAAFLSSDDISFFRNDRPLPFASVARSDTPQLSAQVEANVSTDSWGGQHIRWTPDPAGGAMLLRLSESYDDDWSGQFTALAQDGSQQDLAATRVRGPGDVLSWSLDVPRGVKEIRGDLHYRGQGLTKVGSIISLAVVVLLVGALLAFGVRDRRRRPVTV